MAGAIFIAVNFLVYDYVELPGEWEPITFVHKIDHNKDDIFRVMTDVENYPNIFPKNVIFVEIINKTNNVIFTKESIHAKGNNGNFTVKHTFFPFDIHQIEILDGDAKGTKIVQTFRKLDTSTEIKTEMDIKLVFKLYQYSSSESVFSERNLEDALDFVMINFESYAAGKK